MKIIKGLHAWKVKIIRSAILENNLEGKIKNSVLLGMTYDKEQLEKTLKFLALADT